MDPLSLKTKLLCEGASLPPEGLPGGRRVGAGPAGLTIIIEGMVVNLPLLNEQRSPNKIRVNADGGLQLTISEEDFNISLIEEPSFYQRRTSSGVPMKKVALRHGLDCLATTVFQRCILKDKGQGCSFCAIEGTLKSGATILRKKPEDLRETAEESLKDGISHMVITSGVPNLRDYGFEMMKETIPYLKERINIPISVQVMPLGKDELVSLKYDGADTLGIHMESLDRAVLKDVCPGKHSLDHMSSLKDAVEVFGEGQVSTFIIAGLGEDPHITKNGLDDLIHRGVVPFLVPFRPLPGTRLEDHPSPPSSYMEDLYLFLGDTFKEYGLDPSKHRAGCVRCGACWAGDLALLT